MKKFVDLKRRDVEFKKGELVFLKIKSYRQMLLRRKRNEKHEWLTQLKEIYGYGKNPTIKEWEVLISWKGLPPHEVTWEDYNDF